MRRATAVACLLLLALIPARVRAAELLPFIENRMVGAQLRGLQFPPSLPKDLTSGLTSHIIVRVTLEAPGRLPTRRVVEMTVKYDLWEETFRFTLAVDNRSQASETFATREAVLAKLRDARFTGLFQQADLAQGVSHTLKADVLLNPIDQERMENIRKWVAANSTYAPGQSGVPDARTDSTSNELFNLIFEQYTAGAGVAVWRESVVSVPFRAEAVSHERP